LCASDESFLLVALKLNSALILLSSSILKPVAIIIIIIVMQSHIENYAKNYKERATLKKTRQNLAPK